jgi:putative phage-type endonuclease
MVAAVVELVTAFAPEGTSVSTAVTDIVDEEACDLYASVLPARSLECDAVPWLETTPLSSRLERLFAIPLASQRTEAWYEQRRNMITASSAAKVLGSQARINELICEKCRTASTSERPLNIDTALHWGVKYEPVSAMYYESVNGTKLRELGCVSHPEYSFIGASPDGINVMAGSPLFGRMLEIKNPLSRVITGTPKNDYWVQMQIQMEVCNLDRCDFLETKFEEYESDTTFKEDGTFTLTADGKVKGIIMYFAQDRQAHYEYAPIGITEEEFEKWEADMMGKNADRAWVSNIYWKLEEVSCVLVLRNPLWFQAIVPLIASVWSTIERERISGDWHERTPVHRPRTSPPSGPTRPTPPTLLVSLVI